jgi:hypothetical protein
MHAIDRSPRRDARDSTEPRATRAARELPTIFPNGIRPPTRHATPMNPTPEHEVLASEQSLLTAMKTSDVSLLDALLHDDLLFNGPTGETATKAADLANYRSGNIRLRTVESSDLTSSAIGDDVVVAVTVSIEGSYMGQEIDGQFRYLRVWKRFGTGWRVIAGSVVALGVPIR